MGKFLISNTEILRGASAPSCLRFCKVVQKFVKTIGDFADSRRVGTVASVRGRHLESNRSPIS